MRNPLLLAILLLIGSAPVIGEQPRQQWAVIAAPQVAASGLSDLLTVRLSREPAIELVERERLQEATRELELAAILKPAGVEQRLQLGRTLRAHALMVLSFERQQDRRMLRVVVCDSLLGVRLWNGQFDCDGEDLEAVAEQCAATVVEVRQRFAGGIQQIIAAPPFLSENFTHEYDYLQTRFSDILAGALIVQAGVAVVEVEEARAILGELRDSLYGGLERPIATIVTGKFRVGPLTEANRRVADLDLELVGGPQQQRIRKSLVLGAVGPWLAKDLSLLLLGADQAAKTAPLGAEIQRAILSRHAARFAQLGDWEHSIALREAALVLDPNDALQRGLAISEYQFTVSRAVDRLWFKTRPPVEQRKPVMQRAADDYCVALDHLEYLVRNKLVRRADAVGLFHTQQWCRSRGGNDLPEVEAVMAPACDAQRKFVRDVVPLMIELPVGRALPAHLSTPNYSWQYVVPQHVMKDVQFNGYNPASLASLQDLLERILPATAGVSDRLLNFLDSPTLPGSADWQTLLENLCKSDNRLAQIYGRWGMLSWRHRQLGRVTDRNLDQLRPLLDEIESLLAEVKRQGRSEQAIQTHLVDAQRQMNNLIKAFTTTPQPAAPGPRPYKSLGRMQFTPIQLVVKGEPKRSRPLLILGMLACGECDAYWTKDQFFFMHEPDVLNEVKLTENATENNLFLEPTWDGQCVWVFVRGEGVVCVQPDGKRLATFNLTHLPGYSNSLRLLGLSPRRALMVASFGQSNRAWCGILEVDDNGKQSAKVFFEAKRVAAGRTAAEAADDPATAFVPERLFYVRGVQGRSFVLVEREGVLSLSKLLRIDLQTLKVTVSGPEKSSTRTDLGFNGAFYFDNGQWLSSRADPLNRFNSRQLVLHEGWLYAPGFVWQRIDPQKRKPERLQPWPSRLPFPYSNLMVSTSAHYGLVGSEYYSSDPPLFQITILDEDPAGGKGPPAAGGNAP